MKAILFDASGVLYYRPDKHRMVRDFLKRHHLPVPEIKPMWRATGGIRASASTGGMPLATYYDQMLTAWGVEAPTLRAEGYRVLAAADHDVCLYEGVVQTVEVLRARGFKLGVVTDTVVSTLDAIRRLADGGLDVDWDAFANSVDVGARKPDPRPYHAALAQCGVAAGATVYVGHQKDELDTAHRLGMTTVGARYRSVVEADYTIDRFADLQSLPFLQQIA